MTYLKIHSTPEWREHLDQLATRVGLPSRQALIEEAVRIVAEAAGMQPQDRFPNPRLDRDKLTLSRVAQHRSSPSST
jgi:hypothetical protein